ncbi:MAG: dCTP deaminase [Deltaproteobacteria bacterium]|nr:dCTP deaminase [Deltaproteobacteria bacterium]
MGVKADHWIRMMVERYQMIEPFVDHQVRGGISYGLSSYGYDFRLAPEFHLPQGVGVLDPKQNQSHRFTVVQTETLCLPAGGYCLGRTVEYFRIPRDVLTICYGKSTYARSGIVVNVTPFEPEWEGTATIALVNCSGRPATIYANEGIGQLIFLGAESHCDISYADRKGKYQAQQTVTQAKI